MTVRQLALKLIYPLIMVLNKWSGKAHRSITNQQQVKPPRSFYDLPLQLNNGTEIKMEVFRGKKVLLVNTASNCGYTGQYEALQQLHQQYREQLVVIGFPANDFKEQEKGNDGDIAAFCKLNYGVDFPLARKSHVKGTEKNPVFEWLSNKQQNGWNEQEPVWNFSKYLVSESGILLHYFDPGVSPTGKEITSALQNNNH